MQRLTLDRLVEHEECVQLAGEGRLLPTAAGVCLLNGPANGDAYVNAQLDDYHGLVRYEYPWRPPVRLHVRARFSHGADCLCGTAGFGFWNDPFMMSAMMTTVVSDVRLPTLPRALWYFFASPPSNMALAKGVPGRGWKAATIDAHRAAFLALAPTASVGVLLMHSPWLYDKLWPVVQKALAVNEALLEHDMTAWHDYVIDWQADKADFFIDDVKVLHAAPAPRGPLGLVIWLDNQAMIVTPQGKLRHTLVARDEQQWLEIAELDVASAG